MSTKRVETCSECGTEVIPTDMSVKYEDDVDFFVKLWRYVCGNCGWVWANTLQRVHNEREYGKARKNRHARLREYF